MTETAIIELVTQSHPTFEVAPPVAPEPQESTPEPRPISAAESLAKRVERVRPLLAEPLAFDDMDPMRLLILVRQVRAARREQEHRRTC